MGKSRPRTGPSQFGRSPPRRFRRMFLMAVGVLVGAVLAAIYAPGLWKKKDEQKSVESIKTPQEAEIKEGKSPVIKPAVSPYKNTLPGVLYVGSQACVACHEEEHKTYQHTGMARSMAAVDLAREPPDGAFDHPASGCRYEVRRRDGQMWHRELLLAGGKEVLLQEHPVTYVTGSGRHSLTYVIEDDGFMAESPITWYTSRKAWGMSPGYDRPNHSSFEREVGESCLVCHAGQVKAEGKSFHRMQITEAAIGCEQCHGPGELHVQKRKEQTKTTPAASEPDIDDTIVNPARLSRDLSEAICQQCHLRGSAAVLGKGKTAFDFRPGLPLAQFVQHYALNTHSTEMSVVGHVEQMHLGKCFQMTKTFSCLTCHGPHGDASGEALTKHYIQVCTNCHQPETCRVSPEVRQKENPQNNCLTCHMPQTPTDIPHLAFTHHRVDIHNKATSTEKLEETAPPTLEPMFELSLLDEEQQKRSLGLAFLELANKEENPTSRAAYQRQALSILTEVRSTGGVDGTVDAWLARLRFELGRPDVQRYAQAALADPQLTGQDLCTALFLQADAQYYQRRYQEAIQTLEQIGKLRRHSLHWLLMAQCQKAVGDEQAMEAALLKAVHINPRLTKVHNDLAEIYRKRGNEAKAQYHAARGVER